MDLSTEYLGLKLNNPLVPSASPLSKNLDSAKRLEDAGASALVMYSLFEEEVTEEDNLMDSYLYNQDIGHNEANGYLPFTDAYQTKTDEYLAHIFTLKNSLDIQIIASLNGVTTGGWVDHAIEIEQAGASYRAVILPNMDAVRWPGRSHRPNPLRDDGQRQHLPSSGDPREGGHHARPALRWASPPAGLDRIQHFDDPPACLVQRAGVVDHEIREPRLVGLGQVAVPVTGPHAGVLGELQERRLVHHAEQEPDTGVEQSVGRGRRGSRCPSSATGSCRSRSAA